MESEKETIDYDVASQTLPKEEILRNIAEFERAAEENKQIVVAGMKFRSAFLEKDKDPDHYKKVLKDLWVGELGLTSIKYEVVSMVFGSPNDSYSLQVSTKRTSDAAALLQTQCKQIKGYKKILEKRQDEEAEAKETQERETAERVAEYLSNQKRLVWPSPSRLLECMGQLGFVAMQSDVPLYIHMEKQIICFMTDNGQIWFSPHLAKLVLSFVGKRL